MLISVFTPTYNRALLLPRLYESLKVLTFMDFEWLIVDDGSVDDTESLLQSYSAYNAETTIRYYKQINDRELPDVLTDREDFLQKHAESSDVAGTPKDLKSYGITHYATKGHDSFSVNH